MLPRSAEHQRADIFSILYFAVAISHDHQQAQGKQPSPPGTAVAPASTAAAARCEKGQPGGTAPRPDTFVLPGVSSAAPGMGGTVT